MISIDLKDGFVSENARAILELQKLGMFSDAEIQEMYDKQVAKDKAEENVHS